MLEPIIAAAAMDGTLDDTLNEGPPPRRERTPAVRAAPTTEDPSIDAIARTRDGLGPDTTVSRRSPLRIALIAVATLVVASAGVFAWARTRPEPSGSPTPAAAPTAGAASVCFAMRCAPLEVPHPEAAEITDVVARAWIFAKQTEPTARLMSFSANDLRHGLVDLGA